MRQALITNYVVGPGRTNGHTLEQNPPPQFVRHQIVITADEAGTEYTAVFRGGINGPLGGAFGTLSLYEDQNGDMWINHVEVAPQAQRCRVARKMVEHAIARWGHVYASNSPFDPGGDDDTRHLSVEGAALVNGLIQANVMQANWLRAPVV